MKLKIHSLAISLCLLNYFCTSSAFGCRYTVREIGFTDLSVNSYKLYFYTNNKLPEDYAATFKKISYTVLLDANVEVEFVNVDEKSDHPAMKYYHSRQADSLPTTILVSPEGQSIRLPLSTADQSYKEAVWSTLEKIIASPVREKILKSIVKAHSIVLLVEGTDASKNKRAQKAIKQALEKIHEIMPRLPKPMDTPPELIVLPYKSIQAEKVLVWSLGFYDKTKAEPGTAILYGRGRRMGPPITGKRITENTIFNLLGLVGADCECGLERSWILGSMIPLRWPPEAQKELVSRLGFDVENPMVKAEMSQILALGARLQRDRSSNELLHGYSEKTVEFKQKSSVPKISFSQMQNLNSPASKTGLSSALKFAFYVIGGLFLIISGGGIFIYLRSRKFHN